MPPFLFGFWNELRAACLPQDGQLKTFPCPHVTRLRPNGWAEADHSVSLREPAAFSPIFSPQL